MRATVRRCLSCRKSAPKEGLFRFALKDGRLTLDMSGKLPGRGAYVHSSLACVSRMGDAGIWEHALRLTKGSLAKESVLEASRAARKELGEAAVAAPVAKVRL